MSDAPDRSAYATVQVLKWILYAQIVLAMVLIVVDFAPAIPNLLNPTSAPTLDQPIGPGDQTRQYRPNRPATPGPGVDPDMPRRLVADAVEVDGEDALSIRGAIAPGDGTRIVADLQSGRPAIVLFDSPGGSVADALAIGRAVRDIGAKTRLDEAAVCFSACPYMFVGGLERQVSDTARLGVHQHSFGESTILPAFLAVDDIQRGQAGVLRHLDDMGIDLRIMGPAMATPADEIYILTANELREWNVASDQVD